MSRKRRGAGRTPGASQDASATPARGAPLTPPASPQPAPARTPLTPRKRAIFLAITLALPLLLLAAIELGLRIARPNGGLPLFVTAPVGDGRWRVASRDVARRWFGTIAALPAPPIEPFAADKPANGFRLFVLGESTTAGFPWPHNGTFSRVLRDVLHDVLPHDSVEVINLGVAATNSYALADIAREVAAERPDAVLIYAGHNEYHGVLGAASTLGASSPALVRLSLGLQRSRMYLALRDLLTRRHAAATAADSAPSFMEVLAREQYVALGDERFRRGVRQFGGNLERTIRTLRAHGIPVFVASLASNLRDLPPFAAPPNETPQGARAMFTAARAALAAGDTAGAAPLFTAARDADVVRFRAPALFDSVIAATAASTGAVYVPVGESFASAAPARVPGAESFLEHVHPTRQGVLLIARAFFDAMRAATPGRRQFDLARLRPWEAYDQAMALTPFDERIAMHTVRTLTARWPFVSPEEARDYRGSYRPPDPADSLAFAVSRGGARWLDAKRELGQRLERAGAFEAAAAEYAGLVRDLPLSALPLRLMARALMSGGRLGEAEGLLIRAMRLEPSGDIAFDLARIRLAQQRAPEAVPLLEQATRMSPMNAGMWYQLSLAYGLTRDLPKAREAALRAAQLDPRWPGLQGWLATIGVTP